MASTIATPQQLRKSFASNFNKFSKRQFGLEAFIPKDYLRDTYQMMLEKMHPHTRTSVEGVRDLAERMDIHVATVQRRQKALVRLGVIRKRQRKSGCRANLTNQYTFPVLDRNFLLERCGGDGRTSAGVIQEQILKPATTTPRASAESMCVNPPVAKAPEPPRPKPDAEVIASEQAGRELARAARAERKAAARSVRYAAAKARPKPSHGLRSRLQRHQERVSPANAAAGEVLRLCGVSDTSWELRAAIAGAMELHEAQSGTPPARCVEAMVFAYQDYLDQSESLFRPVNMANFFKQGLWCDRRKWIVDREWLRAMRAYARARIGS